MLPAALDINVVSLNTNETTYLKTSRKQIMLIMNLLII